MRKHVSFFSKDKLSACGCGCGRRRNSCYRPRPYGPGQYPPPPPIFVPGTPGGIGPTGPTGPAGPTGPTGAAGAGSALTLTADGPITLTPATGEGVTTGGAVAFGNATDTAIATYTFGQTPVNTTTDATTLAALQTSAVVVPADTSIAQLAASFYATTGLAGTTLNVAFYQADNDTLTEFTLLGTVPLTVGADGSFDTSVQNITDVPVDAGSVIAAVAYATSTTTPATAIVGNISGTTSFA